MARRIPKLPVTAVKALREALGSEVGEHTPAADVFRKACERIKECAELEKQIDDLTHAAGIEELDHDQAKAWMEKAPHAMAFWGALIDAFGGDDPVERLGTALWRARLVSVSRDVVSPADIAEVLATLEH